MIVDLKHRGVVAYIALGANLGDAQGMLRWAMDRLAQTLGVTELARSSLYRSAPVDSSGPDYINAVMAVMCALPAYELLRVLQQIELQAGRERPYRNAPRTLDLDLLLYGDAQIRSEVLELPHPRMNLRAFVLLPLHEIAPQRVSAAQLSAVSDQQIERI